MATGYESEQQQLFKSIAISLVNISEELHTLNKKLNTLNERIDSHNYLAAQDK
jgi:hypothetical protein